MKRIVLLIGLIFIFQALRFLPAADADGLTEANIDCSRHLTVNQDKEAVTALKGLSGDVVNASIMKPRFSYYQIGCYSSRDKKVSVKKLVFRLSDASGVAIDDLGNFRLFADVNLNLDLEPDKDRLVAKGVFYPDKIGATRVDNRDYFKTGNIVFSGLNIEVSETEIANLFLVVDISNLETGDCFSVALPADSANIGLKENYDDSQLIISGDNNKIEQYAGNRAPFIGYNLNKNIACAPLDGGLDGTNFEFSVIYNDPEGDGAAERYLEIDEAGDGNYKRYEMIFDGPAYEIDKGCSVMVGDKYKIIRPLNFTGEPVKYRFVFSDGENLASGKAAGEQTVTVLPWLMFVPGGLQLNPTQILPGQKIEISGYVFKHTAVKVDWEQMNGKEYPWFTVEKTVIRRSMPYNNDFEILELAIYIIPRDNPAGFGKQAISDITFDYRVEKRLDKTNLTRDRSVKLPPLEFEITPVIVSHPQTSKNIIFLGDTFTYKLELFLCEGARVKTGLDSLSLGPFLKLKDQPEKKIVIRGGLTTETYIFTVWLFELPAKGETRFSFPSSDIEIEKDGQVYTVNIPSVSVGFAPTLNAEELDRPFP